MDDKYNIACVKRLLFNKRERANADTAVDIGSYLQFVTNFRGQRCVKNNIFRSEYRRTQRVYTHCSAYIHLYISWVHGRLIDSVGHGDLRARVCLCRFFGLEGSILCYYYYYAYTAVIVYRKEKSSAPRPYSINLINSHCTSVTRTVWSVQL